MVIRPPHFDTDVTARIEATLERDRAAQTLGIRITDCGVGFAELSMQVQESNLNALDIQHGGTLFTLGDTCFAAVCVSLGNDAVSRQAEISFISPAHLGEVLTATGKEILSHGRSIIVDVSIKAEAGRPVAALRVHGAIPRLLGE